MADNLSHLRNMKRRLTQNKPSANMSPLEKVDMLEKTLSTFRSEVNMKLQIMQQILTTRNEQVSVQKKLLDREQNLYNVLLGHWMNTPNLAASGLSMNFSAEFEESGEDFDYENEENLSDPDYSAGEELSAGPSRKKSKSSLRRQRKSGRIVPKQNQTQQAQDQGEYHHAPDADDGSDDGADEPGNQVEVQMKGEYDTEDTATLGTGMNEFNEFMGETGGIPDQAHANVDTGIGEVTQNWTSTTPGSSARIANDSALLSVDRKTKSNMDGTLSQSGSLKSKASAKLRKKFLREHFTTNGQSRCCNLCNAQYKLSTATSNLNYHLKNAHQLSVSLEPNDMDSQSQLGF